MTFWIASKNADFGVDLGIAQGAGGDNGARI